MAKRSSFAQRMAQQQREQERAARARERARMASAREAERARKAYERATALEEKERKRLYAEARAAEVAALNEALANTERELASILEATLDVDDYLDFEALRERPQIPAFQPGALATAERPPDESGFVWRPLSG